MDFTFDFLRVFFWSIYFLSPLIIFLSCCIIVLGQIVSSLEKWNRFDGLYWSFITATTVGYGDIRPTRKISKVLSIMIAFIGMVFTGIVIALAVNSVTTTFEKHVDKSAIEQLKNRYDQQEK